MKNIHAWACLSEAIGRPMDPQALISSIARLNRSETLFTLARIASALANAEGGALGAEARSWTHDLLGQRQDSVNGEEAAVSRWVAQLPADRAIAHAQVIFHLQLLTILHASALGRIPADGYLAFLMLAANDYAADWPHGDESHLSATERNLAQMFLTSIFNRSDDALRSLVRTVRILGARPERVLRDSSTWEKIQQEAFGTTFETYVEAFLAPLFLISHTWTSDQPPVVLPSEWTTPAGIERALLERWFAEASVGTEAAASAFSGRTLASGLPGLPPSYFRTPFISVDDKLLALSPWHVRDHARLGTWAKLNEATKKVLNTQSSQTFSSAFGEFFERWCADIAREAAEMSGFVDTLILPLSSGSADEIEDVILTHADTAVLLSVKASLVPETALKGAARRSDAVKWLHRFFLEDPEAARGKGHRGGALFLLDKKIQRLRQGAFEERGLRRDLKVLPVVVCYDFVGESGILYKWLEEECLNHGILSARPDVRPLTVATAEEYEALMAFGTLGQGICDLLLEKTSDLHRWSPLDQFLYARVDDTTKLRLPSMSRTFSDLVDRCRARVRREPTR